MAYAKPQFPVQVWDGTSSNTERHHRSDIRDPNSQDRDQVVSEVCAIQAVLLQRDQEEIFGQTSSIGPSGPIGLIGPSGPSGPSGSSGSSGSSGLDGPSGPSGSNATNQVRIGCFTCPAATGNYLVTGLGFRPKAVKFWVSKGPGVQTHFCCCQGMMDAAGNQNSMTWAGVFSNIFKGDSRIDLCIYTINSSGNSQVTGGFVSMDADGFTLNFTVVNTAFIVRWEAIG